MIDWATIKSTAHDVIADVMQLKPDQVRWRDEAEGGTWMLDPTITLRIFGTSDIGYAEELRSTPNATDDQVVTVSQQKRFTLSVRAESFTQKIDDPKNAAAMLETLKTRLQRSTSITRMAGIFGIAAFQSSKNASYVDENNRMVNAFVMDLSCSTVDNDVDTSQDAGKWIGSTQGQGVIKQTGPGSPPADTTINFLAGG